MKRKYIPPLLLLAAVCLNGCDPTTAPVNYAKTATGTVTMEIKANGLRTSGDGKQAKKQVASANLVFNLDDIVAVEGIGSTTATWRGTPYGGLSYWFEAVETRTNCIFSEVTDRDTTVRSFSSTIAGNQEGDVNFSLMADGTYRLSITPFVSGRPTTKYRSSWIECPASTHTSSTTTEADIPLIGYFSSELIGEASPQANRIQGIYHAIDSSKGIGEVPLDITISWDIQIKSIY